MRIDLCYYNPSLVNKSLGLWGKAIIELVSSDGGQYKQKGLKSRKDVVYKDKKQYVDNVVEHEANV